MKTLPRKLDNEVFDNLLRSHIRRSASVTPACPEFDPDRANAYVERAISGIERTQYERHLSECTGCRTSIVALARMAEAAGPIASPTPEIRDFGNRDASWWASFKAGLLAVASPRWAIVATTLLVIGISLPLALRNESPQPQLEAASTPDVATAQPNAAIAQSEEAQKSRSQQQEPGAGGAGKLKAQPVGLASKPAEREEPRRQIAAADFSKAAETTSGAGSQPAAEGLERKRTEGSDPAVPRDDAKHRDALDKVAASAVAPPAPQVKSADEDRAATRISKNDALTLPREDPSATKVKTLKPGAPDPGLKTEREKEVIAAIRSKDGEAPPKHRAALEQESRAGLASGGARPRALVGESGRADRSRGQEKTVGKKTFWLTRGVWTDAEYNSDRKLPVVTVVRDSDVYKEMLEKNNKLKVFFSAFAVSDRAIIVFKNTVYNLIPQADGK